MECVTIWLQDIFLVNGLNKPGPAEFPPIAVITWLKNVAIVCLKRYQVQAEKRKREGNYFSLN